MDKAIRRPWRVFSLVAVLFVTATVHGAERRVYVEYAPGSKAEASNALKRAGGRVHHEFDNLNALALSLPEAALQGIARNPNIVLFEDDPVRGMQAQEVPYGVTLVQAPLAVAAGATGAGIKVGVIDSGVYSAHEDFAGVQITGQPDFGPNDQRTWYRDVDSHGTHVTGTITAANNSLGVIGVAPGTISVHMVKVFGDIGQWVYSSDLLNAARAAVAQGSKVINMSLGGGTPSRVEERGLNDLNASGVLLIAAAGNDGNTAYSYPASYASVVSVAAIDQNKQIADFSQQNDAVDLAAPGVQVLSTVSYTETVNVAVGGNTVRGASIEFAARGSATGALVYGGLGDATNAAWSGKVVLVDRGSISFYEKVRNVQLSGGVACIIANNEPGNFSGTLGDGNSSIIPAISVSQEDGTALKSLVGSSATVTSQLNYPQNSYGYFDGTSMATPHVSAAAALIWSKYPAASNQQVRQALEETAEDLLAPGRDNATGVGLIRTKDALDRLAVIVGNGGGGGGDTTPPVISGVSSALKNTKNGSFEITWTTNEPATTVVVLNGTTYTNTRLVTEHRFSHRGSKGALYTYSVKSADAAGNEATAGPFTHQN